MRNDNSWLFAFGLIVLVALFIVGYGFLTGRFFFSNSTATYNPSEAIETARSRVSIGESREDMLIVLSDAWFHSECKLTESDIIEDLFFYGPREVDEVQVIIIRSTNENSGPSIVNFIGTVENYMLHLYDYCTPSPMEAFNETGNSR